MSHDFFKDSKVLGVWTQISRILGLIRDNFCGRLFGTSVEFGAFTIAFRIPDLFRRLLDEGALTAGFVPQLVDSIEKEDREKSLLFASTIYSITLITLSLICLTAISTFMVIFEFAPLNEEWRYILKYSIILTPFLIFIGLTALLGSILNVLKHFFAPAFSPVLFNLVWIAGLITAWYCYQTTDQRLKVVCLFITFSGVLQVGLLLFVLRKYNWILKFSFKNHSPNITKIIKKFLPGTFCLAIFQINILIDSIMALFLVDSKHAVAALYYSDRIQQLPLGIIAFSIATASYPMLSRLYSQNKTEEFRDCLTKALRGVWFLTIPSCIGILYLTTPLVQQFYSFKDPESTLTTANTLNYFSLGLLFTCTIPTLTRAFYVRGDIKTPATIGLGIIFLNILLSILLSYLTDLQGGAIALATSISSMVYAILLFYIADKKLHLINLNQLKPNIIKITISSASLILCLEFLLRDDCRKFILNFSNNIWWFSSHPHLFYLLFVVASGMVSYLLVAILIKSQEFREIFLKPKSDLT